MSDRPFRVLHIIDTFGMGGVETWLMEVLRYLHRTGARVQIDILATSGNRGIFDDEATALGATIVYLAYGRWSIGAFVPAFRRLLRNRQYDVVHDHQGYASGWHFIMGMGLTPQKRVTHFHNRRSTLYYPSLSARIAALLGRQLALRTATDVVGASQPLLNEYAITPRRNRAVQPIYCGLNPQRFIGERADLRRSVRDAFGWTSDARIILNAGRSDATLDRNNIRNVKNTDFAIDVAIACAQRDPRAHVLFAGETNSACVERQARLERAGVADRVRLLGVRRDIERLMLASDAFFLPSRSEGLGMVAVEAQAAGLPVVASFGIPRDCIVAPDLIRFKAIEEGHEAWATDLLDMAATENLRSRAKEISASRFAIEKSVRALNALYQHEPEITYDSRRHSAFDAGGAIA